MRFDANVWAHLHYHGRRPWAMLQLVVRGEREDRVMTELFSESRRTALRALCDTVVPRVEHDAPSHTSDQNRGEKPCC